MMTTLNMGALSRSPIVTSGAIVARIVEVWPHPQADRLWVADIDCGSGWLRRVVHGGTRELQPGDLVAYAPPGARLSTGKSMRARTYRGRRSEGMLCSTTELGWTVDGPDEVAVLRSGLSPGGSTHDREGASMNDMAVTFRRDSNPTRQPDLAALSELSSDLGMEPADLVKAATRSSSEPLSVYVATAKP